MTNRSQPDLIAALACAGADRFDNSNSGSNIPVVIKEADFREILDESLRQRVMPSLYRAVECGTVSVAANCGPTLRDHLEASLATQVRIEAAALRAHEILSAAGVEHRFIKGLATAHLDYDNPALRHFSDVDLLVRPAALEQAIDALSGESGASLKVIRGGRPAIQHAVTVVMDRVEIDIHHRLLQQAAGHLAAHLDLFADPVDYEVCCGHLQALPAPLRLLQAASQNVIAGALDAKWSSDIDVLLLLDHAEEARHAAQSVGLGWLVDQGIARALSAAGESQPSTSHDLRWQDRLLRWTYEEGRPSIIRATLCEAAVAPLRTSILTLVSIIWPGDAYLRSRRRSPTTQLTRQLRRLAPFVDAAEPS